MKSEHDDGAPEVRVAASLADAQAGRLTRHASVQALMEHLDGEQEIVGWVPPDGDKRPEAVTRQGEAAHPTEWALVPLKDLGRWSGGGTPSKAKPEFWTDGTIPWVSPKDMKLDLIIDSEDHITQAAVEGSTAKLIPEGSVLIVTRSGILSHTLPVAVTAVPVTVNQDLKTLTPKEGVLPEYVAWALRCFAREILKTCSKQGTTVSSIETAALQRFEIPVPPHDQQKRIVAEIEKQFSRLDEAVANLKRVKANLKRYKAAVLKAAVEGRLVETEAERARRAAQGSANVAGGRMPGETEGRSFETGEQLLQRILETRRSQWSGRGKYKEPAAPDTTNLPELSEGWVWATYAQIGEVTTGFTPPTADTENFGGDIPFFKPTDLDAGDNVVEAREYLSKKGAEKGRVLPAGSVLVTCIGATIGKTGLAHVDCATNQQINAVSPRSKLMDSAFVYSWTVSPYGYKQIVDNASATTLPILNKSKFEALGVPLPPLSEQHRIVAEVERRLSLLRETEAQVDANLKRAERLRQSILSRAFSGQLA
ncbi:MAG: restriction endonuclease subunit S [Halothiobacillaceae bacterium]|nr:restriction endonuclease subunit S [Halothiobacillaceae bacterium]